MHTLQFDRQTERALTRQAAITGKDVDQLIMDLVMAFLEEQEDIRDAGNTLARIASGDETATPWEAVKAEHGL